MDTDGGQEILCAEARVYVILLALALSLNIQNVQRCLTKTTS